MEPSLNPCFRGLSHESEMERIEELLKQRLNPCFRGLSHELDRANVTPDDLNRS